MSPSTFRTTLPYISRAQFSYLVKAAKEKKQLNVRRSKMVLNLLHACLSKHPTLNTCRLITKLTIRVTGESQRKNVKRNEGEMHTVRVKTMVEKRLLFIIFLLFIRVRIPNQLHKNKENRWKSKPKMTEEFEKHSSKNPKILIKSYINVVMMFTIGITSSIYF